MSKKGFFSLCYPSQNKISPQDSDNSGKHIEISLFSQRQERGSRQPFSIAGVQVKEEYSTAPVQHEAI